MGFAYFWTEKIIALDLGYWDTEGLQGRTDKCDFVVEGVKG
jgi:hypothetical protein